MSASVMGILCSITAAKRPYPPRHREISVGPRGKGMHGAGAAGEVIVDVEIVVAAEAVEGVGQAGVGPHVHAVVADLHCKLRRPHQQQARILAPREHVVEAVRI